MDFMGWLRGATDASTNLSSLPGEGAVSTKDTVAPNLVLPLSASPVIKAIRETKTLTTGIVLGLVIIFTIGYLRSPWRKLPPSPRGLPILGNSLLLRDKSWLLSKDCKEKYGELNDYVCFQGDAKVYLRKLQGRSCTLTGPDSP